MARKAASSGRGQAPYGNSGGGGRTNTPTSGRGRPDQYGATTDPKLGVSVDFSEIVKPAPQPQPQGLTSPPPNTVSPHTTVSHPDRNGEYTQRVGN